MSEDICETVRVVDVNAPDGFVVINACDFDKTRHEVFGAETVKENPRKGKKK